MNYMDQVAKMLGVELGEEFEIERCSAIFKFSDNKLLNDRNYDNCYILNELLLGRYKIKRKPCKPKLGERFYMPNVQSHFMWTASTWSDYQDEIEKLERGLVFRTKEEAVEAAKKMLKALEV